MSNPFRFLFLMVCFSVMAGFSPCRAEPFKVGLLTPGPVSDKGWNAGAYEGPGYPFPGRYTLSA